MQKQEIVKIYRDNVERVYRYFYKRTFSKEVSEDLTSECFHLLLENLHNSKPGNNIELTENYIIGIAKHLFLGYLRRKYVENVSVIDDLDNFADNSNSHNSNSQGDLGELDTTETYSEVLENRLLDLIPKLPDAQREVITLRFVERLSLSEITKKLNKDMNYVKVTQRRAIAKLRELNELSKI